MRALLQRIKELDRHAFEDFCFHLLKEMYPNAGVRKVHGAAGDEGVDIFAGEWDGSSVVWQCKSFPNGVGASQKEQIRDSLRRVMNAVKPDLWVLILSVDLDIKTHRWWDKLKASYADRVTLELVSASDLVHQLIYRRTLREAFFPAAIMDVSMLRATLAQSTHFTTDQMATLSADNAAQFLDDLGGHDPRFAFEVTYRSNTGPVDAPLRSGVLLRVQSAERTIDVLPRDLESLSRDPPTFRFTFTKTGADQLRELIETGKPAEIPPGGLLEFSSDFDFLLPGDAGPPKEWQIAFGMGKREVTAARPGV